MTKGQTTQTILLAGACALGVGLFFGGLNLRDRTDPLQRVQRREASNEDFLATRDQKGTEIPLGDFYNAMTDLLKHEYVEAITDDQKLASGAVRGMVLSLGDPRCNFMDAKEFRAYLNARMGTYEGIGAEFGLRGSAPTAQKTSSNSEPTDDPREAILTGHVPYLAVTMVVPGGPADKAGVKPGDIVSDIDGHWVVDDAEIVRFDQARKAFADKKIPFAAVSKLQKDLRSKVERALMPAKAKDRLALGSMGQVTVVWKRLGVSRKTVIQKAPSTIVPFGVKGGALAFRFDSQAAGWLKDAIKGKSEVTLDLRNNVDGDFGSMRKVLAVVAPDGTYGTLTTHRKESAERLVVREGNAHPPKLVLRVDRTTRGAAAIFARALESRHLATLTGGPVGDDLFVKEVVGLPDGTGYTLVTSEYRPSGDVAKVALAEEKS